MLHKKHSAYNLWIPVLPVDFWVPVLETDGALFFHINIITLSVASLCTPHLSMMPILTFNFDLWPQKINEVYPLTIVINMSAKFGEEAHNGLVFSVFTSLFSYMSIATLTFKLQNQLGPSSHYG